MCQTNLGLITPGALASERGPFVNYNSTTMQKDERGRNGNQFAKFTKLHRLPKK